MILNFKPANNRIHKRIKWIPWFLVSIFILGFFHTYWYKFYQPDDAFIYLVYVRSFLNGMGLTFNGELVEGYSSILWTLIISGLSLSGLDPLLISKCVGWIFYLLTSVLIIWIHRSISDRDKPFYLFSLILYFSIPSLALWASGAMETILFTCLISAAVFLYYYGRIVSPSLKLIFVSGIFFGMLSATRPEGFALFGTVFVFELILLIHKRKLDIKYPLYATLIYTILTSVTFLVRWLIYGDWFPTTVSAKTGDIFWQLQSGTNYMLSFIKQYPLLVILYVSSLAYLFIAKRSNSNQYFLTWITFIVVSGYLFFNLFVGGDWMLGWRFLVPILPLIVLTIGIAMSNIRSSIAITILIVSLITLALKTFELHNTSFLEAQATKGDILMGKYIKSLGFPESAKIAVVDAGAIPYFSELPTIDMIGLNDRHISKLPGGFLQKYDNDYVLRQKPEIIQFHTKYVNDKGDVAPTESFIGSLVLFYTPEFQKWYERDVNSPIPHLFKRREQPLDHTFLDTYYDLEITGTLDKSNKINITLKKTGDGIWIAQESNHLEAGVVYLRATARKPNGQIIYEEYHSIPKNMVKNDQVMMKVKVPDIKGNYIYSICPVLLGVRDFPVCSNGKALEYSYINEDIPPITDDVVNFNDDRLFLKGWSVPEKSFIWSLGSESFIEFNIKDHSLIKTISLSLEAFGNQSLEIYLNDKQVFKSNVTNTTTINFSAKSLKEGKNTIHLIHPDAKIPSPQDQRLIAIALKQIEFKR